MYWKDQVRRLSNNLLKIDIDYLTKSQILHKYPNSFDSKKGVYEIYFHRKHLKLRNNSSDFRVFKQVLLDEEYQFPTEILQESFDHKDSQPVIFDIGANIGFTSIYFLDRFPEAKIYALEPSVENYQLLNQNLESGDRIKTIKKGLWKSDEILKLNNSQRDKREWSFHLDTVNGFESVEAITLGNLFKETGEEMVDLLKVDIEGAEKQVFFEDESIIESLERVNMICLEIHDEVVSRKKLIDFIAGCSFRIYGKNETIIGIKS